MKKRLILLFGLLCLSCLGKYSQEKDYSYKIVFETSNGAIRNVRRSNSNETLNEMNSLSHYCVELNYEPYTKEDFIKEYGFFDQNFFRETSRLYHTSQNLQVIEKLGVEEQTLDISNYSPYIYLDMETLDSEEVYDFAYEIAKSSLVETIYFSEDRVAKTMDIEPEQTMEFDFSFDVEGGETTLTPRIPYDNYPAGCNLTGNGIKIGILDPSSLDVNDPRISTTHAEVVIDTVSSNNGDHGLSVALVLGTQYGIASDASLYFADCDSRLNILCLENLIDAGCDVVNMSFGLVNLFDNIVYDASVEGYIDYMYNSTGIIMVAATGNGLELVSQAGKVALPAASANVIAVGSVDSGHYLSQFSSCNTLKDVYSKPDLVAVGEGRDIGGYGDASGTSFSAPAVTGTIALILEGSTVNLDMKQILALLAGTANKDILCEPTVRQCVSSTNNTYKGTITVYNTYDETSGLYYRSGAGRLDITKALYYLDYFSNGSKFNDVYLTSTTNYYLGQLSMNPTQTIHIAAAIERIASTYWLLGTQYKSESMPKVVFKVKNSSGNFVYTQPLNNDYYASLKTCTFTPTTSGTYSFYLSVSSIENSVYAKVFHIVN